MLRRPSTQIATLVKPFTADNGFEALENVNSPKVVLNKNMNALYFSRSIIPYQRNAEKREWLKNHTYYKHIGLYAYRVEVLKEITSLPQSSLELAESLERCVGWRTVIPLKPALPKWRQSASIRRRIWSMRNASCKLKTFNE